MAATLRSLQSLTRKKGFVATAALSLALGIGPVVAVTALVDKVLLRPLPYDRADRLVTVWQTDPEKDLERLKLSAGTFIDLREGNRTFEALGSYNVQQLTLTGAGDPTRIFGAAATPALFNEVLRLAPHLGRSFRPEDATPGSEPVAILSHGLWKERFGADPSTLGRTIVLDEEPHWVVGVLPEGVEFENPEPELLVEIKVWTPLRLEPYLRLGGLRFLRVIGRLAKGVEPSGAEADLASVLAAAGGDGAASGKRPAVRVVSLQEQLVQDVEQSLWVLLTAVVLVLLIAWGNVLNLILARLAERRKELGIRAVLGARTGHLLREIAAENTVLALLGGIPGALVGVWLSKAVIAASPREIPRLDQPSVTIEVLLLAGAVSLLTAGLFSLVTAPLVARNRAAHAASEEAYNPGPSGRVLRQGFVAAEIALSVVLLVCGGLLLKSLWGLQSVDLEFVPGGILTAHLELPWSRYGDEERIQEFYHDLLEHAGRIPGVASAALAKDLPLGGEETEVRLVSGRFPESDGGDEPGLTVACRIVSPGYFEAMKIPILRGRGLPDAAPGGPPRFVLNWELARRLSDGRDLLGRTVGIDWFGQELTGKVVGVVADVRHRNPRLEAGPAVYVPLERLAYPAMHLAVRGHGEPTALIPDVRRVVRALDPTLPLVNVEPLESRIDRVLARERFFSLLLCGFGSAGLLLSIVGLYGVLAHSVRKDTRQIGIRMALGARRESVALLILRRTFLVVAVGATLGLGGGFAFARLLSSLLFGVGHADPATALAVTTVLVLLALVAALLPVRRAMRVDPAATLKEQ